LSFIAYLFLYFAFVTNINSLKAKKYLKILVVSLGLVSLYGLLQKTGFDNHLWVQDVPARIFSSLGQPNWLAAWIASLIFLNLAFFNKTKRKSKKILFLAIFIISFSALIFTRSRSGFLAFWLIFLLGPIAYFFPKIKISKSWLLFTCLAILLTILFLSPFPSLNQHLKNFSLISPQTLPQWDQGGNNSDLGSATADIRKTVWAGAVRVFKNHPALGTGPETFAYSYYWYQPQNHNLLSEWDFLYNKAHNEYLNFLATTGLIGTIPYLGVVVFTLLSFLKLIKKNQNLLIIALGAGYLAILITNFFGFSVVAINLLFFLFPAIAFSLDQKKPPHQKVPPPYLNNQQKTLLIIVLLVSLNLVFGLVKYWLADYYFAQGEKGFRQNNYSQAYFNYQKAQRLRKKEPFYTNKIATTCAYLAIAFHQEGNQEEANKFIVLAQDWAEKTIEANPYQVNFYRQQSQTYYLLSGLESKYQKSAYEMLALAHELAPINSKITYNLASLSYQKDNLDQAISWLEKTIELKPDYQDGYYWLAKFYQENNQADKAKEKLEFLINNLNPQYPETKNFLKKLAN
jgi:putative inorganic carbon (HCO3(-)) transporter